GSTAADSAGSSTGTLRGRVTLGAAGITADPAMAFSGSNTYIRVADNPALNVTGDFALEAWVNLSSLTGSPQAVIHKANGGSYSGGQYRLSLTSAGNWRGTAYVGGTSYDV